MFLVLVVAVVVVAVMTVVPVVLVTFVVVVQQARFQDHYHGGASRPETRYVPCICLLIYPYILL